MWLHQSRFKSRLHTELDFLRMQRIYPADSRLELPALSSPAHLDHRHTTTTSHSTTLTSFTKTLHHHVRTPPLPFPQAHLAQQRQYPLLRRLPRRRPRMFLYSLTPTHFLTDQNPPSSQSPSSSNSTPPSTPPPPSTAPTSTSPSLTGSPPSSPCWASSSSTPSTKAA